MATTLACGHGFVILRRSNPVTPDGGRVNSLDLAQGTRHSEPDNEDQLDGSTR